MTAPVVKAKSTKAWVAMIGSLIISFAPQILQFAGELPAPWGTIATGIGVILSAITGKIVHQVSNAPTGTVLVPVPVNPPADGGGESQDNPWK